MIDVDAVLSGPLFNGRVAENEVEAGFGAALDAVGREGQNMLIGRMVTTFRRPTPYYWTQVTVHTPSPTMRRIDDARSGTPVIYGPWLEGVSRRNQRSRFKGYRIWRTMRQRLRQQAGAIAQEALRPYLRRIGAS